MWTSSKDLSLNVQYFCNVKLTPKATMKANTEDSKYHIWTMLVKKKIKIRSVPVAKPPDITKRQSRKNFTNLTLSGVLFCVSSFGNID